MAIISIKKKTRQGAWMYDTINHTDFPKKRVKGWQKTK